MKKVAGFVVAGAIAIGLAGGTGSALALETEQILKPKIDQSPYYTTAKCSTTHIPTNEWLPLCDWSPTEKSTKLFPGQDWTPNKSKKSTKFPGQDW